MKPTEIEPIICEALSTVLGRPVAPGVTLLRGQEPAWDSLKHMELIFSLEERFNVRFSEEEMAQLDSLAQVVERVKGHLAT